MFIEKLKTLIKLCEEITRESRDVELKLDGLQNQCKVMGKERDLIATNILKLKDEYKEISEKLRSAETDHKERMEQKELELSTIQGEILRRQEELDKEKVTLTNMKVQIEIEYQKVESEKVKVKELENTYKYKIEQINKLASV